MEESTEEIQAKAARLNLVMVEIFLTVLGLLLAVAISLDIRRERDRFAETSLYLQGQFDTQINRNLVALHGFAALLKAEDPSKRDALESYTRYLLNRHPYIYMFQIAQSVSRDDLEQFTAFQRQLGDVDYRIKKFAQEGSKIWSPVDGKSDTYFPVIFMEPKLPENDDLMGLDLGSMAYARQPIQLAQASNSSTFSKSFRMPDRDVAYMLIQPVERADKQLLAILVAKAKKFSDIANHVSTSKLSFGIISRFEGQSDMPIWQLKQSTQSPSGMFANLFPRLSATYPLGSLEQPLLLSIEEQLDMEILNWPVLLAIVTGSLMTIPIMLAYSRARHRDEMARLKASNTLFMQANFDALTGLPNRQLFMNRLEQALAVAHRQGLMHAVLYLDLDGFKGINDYYGHSIGDKVLIRAAKIFSRCVREIDTVARLGGDEFVILLQDIDGHAGAEFVASKIRKAFQSSTPMIIEKGKVPPLLGTSIGIAVYPQDATNMTDLIKVADTDMYKDKATRKLAAKMQPATPQKSRAV